jgi:predicted enzyme related to lactoylglutathione lyase
MAARVRNVAFDCADPYELARFWSAVVEHPLEPGAQPGDDEVAIDPPDGPRLFFQAVPEAKVVKNRVHVCLVAAGGDRDAEVARLVGLGATVIGDFRGDGDGWVVLRDPEGNEFCVNP